MLLEKLIIKNFMRIKDANLDFSDKTIIGIRAEGVTDPDRSNYIGKSTIIEAIQYSLTGNSRAAKEIELIHDGEEVMEVITIWKDSNGTSHKIRRGRDINNVGVIEVNFSDKSKDSQDSINELFGITPVDFEQIFYFKQQEIHQFMGLTADKKKKLLMTWLKNDHWREKEQLVLEDVKEKKQEIYTKQVVIKNAELAVGDEQTIFDEYGSAKTKLAIHKTELEKLKSGLADMNVGLSAQDYHKAIDRTKVIEKQLESLSERILERKRKKAFLKGLKTPSREDVKLNIAKFEEHKLAIKESNLRFKNNVETLTYKLANLKQHKGVCPILSEPCERIGVQGTSETIDKDILFNTAKIQENKKKYETAEKEIAWWVDQFNVLSEHDKAMDFLTSSEGAEITFKMLSDEQSKLEDTINSYDKDLNTKLQAVREEIEQAETMISSTNRIMGSLEEKLSQVEKNKEVLISAREEILALNTILGDLQYLGYMFGRNGIPSLEIENAFTEIEETVNFNLSQINPAIKIAIRPDKELQAWETNCLSCGFSFPKGYRKTSCEQCDTPRMKKRKDELTFVVYDNGIERNFDMCSGGLKTIVSLCVRVALSILVRGQNKTNFSTLFLDEIDSALDAVHREQIKDLVVRVLVNQLGFSQVFWISHDKTISQSVPHSIIVKGYEKHSELVWA